MLKAVVSLVEQVVIYEYESGPGVPVKFPKTKFSLFTLLSILTMACSLQSRAFFYLKS